MKAYLRFMHYGCNYEDTSLLIFERVLTAWYRDTVLRTVHVTVNDVILAAYKDT